MSRFAEYSDPDIDGSPYINNNFELVKIAQRKDTLYKARYNGFTHEMEILNRDSNITILDINDNYELTFTESNKVYKTISYIDQYDTEIKRFLVVLTENEKCSLYKEELVNYTDKVEATNSYSKEKPAKYERIKDRYYIKLNNKTTILPLKKKRLLQLFPENEKDLKNYMKKLNPKNEDELIKIITYISSLME